MQLPKFILAFFSSTPLVLSFIEKVASQTKAMTSIIKNKYLFGAVTAGTTTMVYLEKYNMMIEALASFILLDTFLGIWIALKTKTFSWKKLNSTLEKVVVYAIYLYITYILGLLIPEISGVVQWLHYGMLGIMIVTEARSVVKRGYELYPNSVFAPLVQVLDKIEMNSQQKIMQDLNKTPQKI